MLEGEKEVGKGADINAKKYFLLGRVNCIVYTIISNGRKISGAFWLGSIDAKVPAINR